MDDHGRKNAVPDTDELADQATLQRLVRGFRREEEEYNRSHLLYGDDHIERVPEKIPGRE